MKAQGRAFLWIVVVLAGFFAGAARGQEYKIKLDRPAKVGDSYATVVTFESSRKLSFTVDGAKRPDVEEAMAVRLEARNTVLETGKSGLTTKVSCAVAKCLRDGKPVIEPGTVVIAERKGEETAYTVNGEAVAAEVAQVLTGVLHVKKADERHTDDVLMGTDRPQKVGDTWALNAEEAAAAVAEAGIPVKKENVTGTVKLVSVKQVDGREVLRVEADITMDGIAGPMRDGSVVESGKVTARHAVALPVDPSAGAVEESPFLDMALRVKGTTPDGKAFASDVRVTVKGTATYSDRKSASAKP